MAEVQRSRHVKLSDLSNDVLRRIMCNLNARHTVQTCVLSSRWRYLWRALPRINAEFYEFNDEVLFKRFINTLLERRDPLPLIDKFWLRYFVSNGDDLQASSADADRWIRHALQKQAKVVEVVALDYTLEPDHAVFTSTFLRRLGLSTAYLTQGFFNQLKTCCPNLEDLFLYDCIILDHEISSQSLRILTIDITQFSYDYRASISTPSVTSLTLCCPLARVPLLVNMASIVTASVSLNDDMTEFDYPTDIRHLLRSLSGVRKLDLDYRGETVTIENNLQWCPKFINLVYLILGQWCLDSNFYALTVFLQNSPKLEKVTLKLKKDRWSTDERIVGELEERSFTCEHLKIVDVICLEDDPLLKRVEDFFVASGMTSLQINVIHWSQIQHEDPAEAFFRYKYRGNTKGSCRCRCLSLQ